jgi:hypothetical protein
MGLGEELEGEGDEYMAPPDLNFDHVRDSLYYCVHGAPLHKVVEEGEEK